MYFSFKENTPIQTSWNLLVEIYMLMKLEKVMEELGVKKTAVYQMVKDEIIPKPIKVGGSSRWLSEEIDDAIKLMIARRDEDKPKATRRGRPPRYVAASKQ